VSRLKVDVTEEDQDHISIRLHGTATFLQLPILADKLENIPRRKQVHIMEEHLVFIDHACLDLILCWSKQYEASGGEVILDLDGLHTKYHGSDPVVQSKSLKTPNLTTTKETSAKAS
jgi:hypothetical protein